MSASVANLKYHIYNRRFGLWLFIASESVIFLTLLVTRFYMQGTFRPHEKWRSHTGIAADSSATSS
ncbi:MAG: hypothetical protein HZB17_10335 [Chloroflexi bacterium]|nr:hypothetical protein [Chloroflexota bacterium]